MALFDARPAGTRQPVLPTRVKPLPPPPAQAVRVLQSHRTPTQLSLFSTPVTARPAGR